MNTDAILKGQQEQINAMQETVRQMTVAMERTVEVKAVPSTQDRMANLASLMDVFVYDPTNDLTFESWYDRYADIFTEDAKFLGDAGQVRLLLMKLETVANEQYRASLLPDNPSKFTFVQTVQKLKEMFAKKTSLFRTRWDCLQVQRNPDEEITAYGARVNRLAERFRLADLTADQFKCILFIHGLQDSGDKNIRTRLLNLFDKTQVDQLKLTKMMEEAERILQIEHDTALIAAESPAINSVSQSRQPAFKKKSPQTGPKKSVKPPKSCCWKCGDMHWTRDCPFKDRTCKKCRRKGHKEGYCPTSKSSPAVRIITVPEPAVCTATVKPVVEKQQLLQVQSDPKFVLVKLNNKPTTLLLDSGADISIITTETWFNIGAPAFQTPEFKPCSATDTVLPIKGFLKLQVDFQGQSKSLPCLVSGSRSDLFGNDWMKAFGLWDRAPATYCRSVALTGAQTAQLDVPKLIGRIQDKYSVVFSPTLGCCKDVRVHLNLMPDCAPVFRPKRTVPFHAEQKVHAELERLEQSGIITPVPFSKFAAPIVVVAKANGGIRICGDYSTGLNKILQPHQYPIPTPERIFASLAGSKFFTQIDLSDAYLQLQMDEESSALLTINTSKGLFSFNRLCPGVHPAAGIFQQTMDTVLAGIRDVIVYFDDILIASKSASEHHQAIDSVFNRLSTYNLRVRLDKCRFYQSEVRYLGILVDQRGQRPDPAKIEAITSMPAPTNVPELRSLLGAITFYSRFVKDMSTVRAPLDGLLKKDAQWKWTPACAQAVERFKSILTSDLLLTHFDAHRQVTIAADASNYGIGCVAYHEWDEGKLKPFHHVSRRLSDAEKRYSQPEKEALAIVFGVTKFHQYLWGRKFTLITDHRPLISIFGSTKGIPAHTSNRLQRWALILLAYDFEIKYLRTTEFGHADVLSRLIADKKGEPEDFVIAELAIQRQLATTTTDLFSITFETIGMATSKDTTLKEVMRFVTNGWPASAKQLSGEIRRYFGLKDDLSVNDQCLMYRDRTVVPAPYRQHILAKLHRAHQGATRMKSLARQFVFWPAIDADITSLVSKCQPCQLAAKSPVKAPLASWPTPTGPWQRVHADFAGPVNGRSYLLLVDAFSKWPEVCAMTTTTAQATILRIKDVCARLGNMVTLVTDNGPQFVSDHFAKFCASQCIVHVRTPPYHPQSNGQCERFVSTLKRFLAKAQTGSLDEQLAEFLQQYRATPNDSAPSHSSPAELMFGRPIRTPMSIWLPPTETNGEPNTAMEEEYNRKHGARMREFATGERIRIKQDPNGEWKSAVIIEPKGRVTYTVNCGGRVVLAHINQMRSAAQGDSDHLSLDPEVLFGEDQPKRRRPWRNPRAVTRTTPPVLRPRRN